MNESPQRLGKGMIYVAWLLLLGLLFLFFNHFLKKQDNPNQEPITQYQQDGTREVRLRRSPSGHYVASGMINGQPVVFLLDTGATVVSIPDHVARRLNLERGTPMLASTANGTITHMQSDEILLGMSFLKHLEFTQRGDTLILRQSS